MIDFGYCKNQKNKKTCIVCGETKSSYSSTNNKFYTHRNKFINDKFGICKECVEKVGLQDDLDDIHLLLRLMDLPSFLINGMIVLHKITH